MHFSCKYIARQAGAAAITASYCYTLCVALISQKYTKRWTVKSELVEGCICLGRLFEGRERLFGWDSEFLKMMNMQLCMDIVRVMLTKYGASFLKIILASGLFTISE